MQRCEADGLVERERDAADGRAYLIRLTARGQAFQAVAEGVQAEFEARLVESLGIRDRDALVRALKGVVRL